MTRLTRASGKDNDLTDFPVPLLPKPEIRIEGSRIQHRWVNDRVRQAVGHEAGVVLEVGPGETVDALVTCCLQRL